MLGYMFCIFWKNFKKNLLDDIREDMDPELKKREREIHRKFVEAVREQERILKELQKEEQRQREILRKEKEKEVMAFLAQARPSRRRPKK